MKAAMNMLLATSLAMAPIPAAATGLLERAIAVHAARLAASPSLARATRNPASNCAGQNSGLLSLGSGSPRS